MPVINIKEQKKALRARFKKLRETCPEDIRQKLDEKLCKSFLSLDEYKNCDALFTFVSGAIECDTKRIIAQAFADGKKTKERLGVSSVEELRALPAEKILP